MDEHTILVHKLLYPTDYRYRGLFGKKKRNLSSELNNNQERKLKRLFKRLLNDKSDSDPYKEQQAAFKKWVGDNIDNQLYCKIKGVYKILIGMLLNHAKRKGEDDSFKKEVATLSVRIHTHDDLGLFSNANLEKHFGEFRYDLFGGDMENDKTFARLKQRNGVRKFLTELSTYVDTIKCE